MFVTAPISARMLKRPDMRMGLLWMIAMRQPPSIPAAVVVGPHTGENEGIQHDTAFLMTLPFQWQVWLMLLNPEG